MSKLSEQQVSYIEDVLGAKTLLMPENHATSSLPVTGLSVSGSTISYLGSFSSPLVLMTISLESKLTDQLLNKIAQATKIPEVLIVSLKQETTIDELEAFFSKVNSVRGIVFGESSFEKLGGSQNYFYDHFSNVITYFGVNWVTTHSLMDLSEGEESQVQNLKRQVWTQLKKVISGL